MIPVRRLAATATRIHSIRLFGTTQPRPFLNLFGKKDAKKREDIIKNQDDFESDPEAKIVILNQENSPDYKPFEVEVDMADFRVNQWKNIKVSKQDIEATYSSTKLEQTINETYSQLKGTSITSTNYSSIDLHDLSFRFEFAKALQKNLGFDVNDYTLTKAHTLEQLYESLSSVIHTRWVSERNPNGIVLRSEDFSAANIYLNQERSQSEQEEELKRLAEQARAAVN